MKGIGLGVWLLGALATAPLALTSGSRLDPAWLPLALWALAAVLSGIGAVARSPALGAAAGASAALGALDAAFPQELLASLAWVIGAAALVEGPRLAAATTDARVMALPATAAIALLLVFMAPVLLLRIDAGVAASLDVGNAPGFAVAGLVMAGLAHLAVTRRRRRTGEVPA